MSNLLYFLRFDPLVEIVFDQDFDGVIIEFTDIVLKFAMSIIV